MRKGSLMQLCMPWSFDASINPDNSTQLWKIFTRNKNAAVLLKIRLTLMKWILFRRYIHFRLCAVQISFFRTKKFKIWDHMGKERLLNFGEWNDFLWYLCDLKIVNVSHHPTPSDVEKRNNIYYFDVCVCICLWRLSKYVCIMHTCQICLMQFEFIISMHTHMCADVQTCTHAHRLALDTLQTNEQNEIIWNG